MAIARRVGGFSPAQADDLRKAISKKNKQLMATLKEPLMEGLAASGVPPAVSNKLWANFEATGDYSFNKSHAACYALISYRTAWLKANYPVEYMAALISSVMNTKDKVPFYVNQCHELGIEVLPPDVNESDVGFTVVEGKIRFGLNAVKGVGVGAIEAIVAARAAGRFTVHLRLLRARRLADGQQARARGARPQRRLRQHRRPAPRDARGAALGDGRRRAPPQGCGPGPGRPVRPGRRRRGQRARRRRRCRSASSTRRALLKAGEGGARPLRLGAPAAGSARAAARRDRGPGGLARRRRRGRHAVDRRHRRQRPEEGEQERRRVAGVPPRGHRRRRGVPRLAGHLRTVQGPARGGRHRQGQGPRGAQERGRDRR